MLEHKQLRYLRAAGNAQDGRASGETTSDPASGPTASGNDVMGNKDM